MNGAAGRCLVMTSGCLIPTGRGLVVYRNRLGDGWVMEVATLVEQGDIDLSLPVRQTVEYVVSIGCTNNLSTTMWGTIGWESGIYPICPGGCLVSTTI